jgi:hypothetical protein
MTFPSKPTSPSTPSVGITINGTFDTITVPTTGFYLISYGYSITSGSPDNAILFFNSGAGSAPATGATVFQPSNGPLAQLSFILQLTAGTTIQIVNQGPGNMSLGTTSTIGAPNAPPTRYITIVLLQS